MQQSLGITDKQYRLALTVFFFPYALFEVRAILLQLVNMHTLLKGSE